MRMVVEEGDGRGRTQGEEPKRRALSLVEQLHRNGHLSYEEYVAWGTFRNMYMLLMPVSEGVSSYGLSPGGSTPHRKADRAAKRLTGVEIAEDGSYTRGPSRANRSARWRYEDALFSMVGVTDDEGNRLIDEQAAALMVKAILETENPPTQGMIGAARSMLKSEKQLSAIGATVVKENLRRLAIHLRLVKGQLFR